MKIRDVQARDFAIGFSKMREEMLELTVAGTLEYSFKAGWEAARAHLKKAAVSGKIDLDQTLDQEVL